MLFVISRVSEPFISITKRFCVIFSSPSFFHMRIPKKLNGFIVYK